MRGGRMRGRNINPRNAVNLGMLRSITRPQKLVSFTRTGENEYYLKGIDSSKQVAIQLMQYLKLIGATRLRVNNMIMSVKRAVPFILQMFEKGTGVRISVV